MTDRSYYHLQVGDYIQFGDEYRDYKSKVKPWKNVDEKWIGLKWGYHPKSGERHEWAEVRRLHQVSKEYIPQGPDLWGEEFEIWDWEKEIKKYKK